MRIYALQYPGKFADSGGLPVNPACIVVTARAPPARHG
jgi:hypothetical protein